MKIKVRQAETIFNVINEKAESLCVSVDFAAEAVCISGKISIQQIPADELKRLAQLLSEAADVAQGELLRAQDEGRS